MASIEASKHCPIRVEPVIVNGETKRVKYTFDRLKCQDRVIDGEHGRSENALWIRKLAGLVHSLRQVESPSVVTVYEPKIDDEPSFAVTTEHVIPWLIDGSTFNSVEDLIDRGPERVRATWCAEIAWQAAKGLIAGLKAGVPHGRLMPTKLLLTAHPWDPTRPLVKLRDLGFGELRMLGLPGAYSRYRSEVENRVAERYMLSEFLNPSIVRATPTTDLYALGAILFQLLTKPAWQNSADLNNRTHAASLELASIRNDMRSSVADSFAGAIARATGIPPSKDYTLQSFCKDMAMIGTAFKYDVNPLGIYFNEISDLANRLPAIESNITSLSLYARNLRRQ